MALTMLGIVTPSASAMAQSDPLVPASALDAAAVSPLRQVTIATSDLAASKRFYADAMGMRTVTPTLFVRNAVPEAAQVRLKRVSPKMSELRPTHNALALGGLAMGMPVAGQAKREAVVTAAGFTSAAGVTNMTLPRGDGTTYKVEEIHYRGPDGVLVLGIDRGDLAPVGPIDVASAIGGPAYASLVVHDLPATEAFLKNVLRYEKRRDAIFTSAGPKGGLGLNEGQRFAFQQWFAPGSRTGYLVIMKMLDLAAPMAVRGEHRGIIMWTFDAADLVDMAARVRATKGWIVSKKPALLIVAMPDGFLVEFTRRGVAR